MIFLRKFKTAVRLFQWPRDGTGAPLAPFLAYVKEQRPLVRVHPDHRYKTSREREQVISDMWKKLDPKYKFELKEKYREVKLEEKKKGV